MKIDFSTEPSSTFLRCGFPGDTHNGVVILDRDVMLSNGKRRRWLRKIQGGSAWSVEV